MPKVIDLLNRRQSDNRADFVRRKLTSQTEKMIQPYTSGVAVGFDATRAQMIVKLDDGRQIYCDRATNGSMTPGERVQVTLTNSNIGWVDSMPRS